MIENNKKKKKNKTSSVRTMYQREEQGLLYLNMLVSKEWKIDDVK